MIRNDAAMNTPRHAAQRNWRLETKPVGSFGGSFTQSVSERYCARCGWTEVRGVFGALAWDFDHREHGEAT